MASSVLHICYYFAPYRGNFIESLEYLADKLNEKGIGQVYLFPACAKDKEASKWIEALRQNGREVYYQKDSFSDNMKLVKNIIKKHNVTTVFKHFSDKNIDLILSLACKKQKVIRFFHCMYNPGNRAKDILLRRIYKDSTLVGVSDAVTENLKKSFQGYDIRTVRNAIYFNRLDETESFQKSEKLSCLCMGYNLKVKGVDLALKACAQLQEKYDLTLYIALASHENELRDEINNIFNTFPDWIKLLPPTEKIGTYYKNTDIFLSPSRSEGFSYALYEAAYCKSTIVASKIPALNNCEADSVYWFESENVSDFVSVLDKAIAEKDMPSSIDIREKTSAKVQKIFSIDSWADNVIELI